MKFILGYALLSIGTVLFCFALVNHLIDLMNPSITLYQSDRITLRTFISYRNKLCMLILLSMVTALSMYALIDITITVCFDQ